MSVIQFPSEPQDGLTDGHIQAAVAECARISSGLFVITPNVGTNADGTRWVSITVDNSVEPMCTFCREGGKLAVFDGDWEAVPRGTNKVVESLRQALKRAA